MSFSAKRMLCETTTHEAIHVKAPLDGVKIIDLTACFTGPSAGPWLADFGAEIIKIEPAQGSEERRISTSLYLQNESRSHRIFYRGKKSFIIDINKPEGKEIVCKLIANSDVIMHNFCYGVMDNLGFDYETLSKINPHIIYVNMSSYGDSGTYNRDFLGYDMFAQGVTRI